MMYSNKYGKTGGDFVRHGSGGQNTQHGETKKVPEGIRKYLLGDEMDGESQYNLFSLEGSIKREYCKMEGDEAKMNQLRKFYDQIISIYEDSSMGGGESIDGRLIRIVPIAKYAKARGLIDEKLMTLIDEGVGIISKEKNPKKKEKCIERFKNVMEAIIAYSKKEKKGGY